MPNNEPPPSPSSLQSVRTPSPEQESNKPLRSAKETKEVRFQVPLTPPPDEPEEEESEQQQQMDH